jgi:predicted DNA-binding transcriptional regulator YafY
MNFGILETIKQAARERKILRIFYVDKSGESRDWREVEPYSLSKDDGERGLFAWDIAKNGIRRFSLDRILQAEIINQEYSPRYPIEIF